ncbi:KCNIP4 [Cordylochernes scorpioides]|uniref:KCNIP4 n=1 Tax=Cordylochernes scorpioides TaxID=51811 RepID=A0ABY6L128_9ARAC|nr:KCNIP4 [Cordylochernes scorpioides]
MIIVDFVQGLSTLSRGSTLEKLQWTFNLYDINGDGRVSKDEMFEITNAIYCLLGRFIEPEVDEESTRDHAERVFQVFRVTLALHCVYQVIFQYGRLGEHCKKILLLLESE